MSRFLGVFFFSSAVTLASEAATFFLAASILLCASVNLGNKSSYYFLSVLNEVKYFLNSTLSALIWSNIYSFPALKSFIFYKASSMFF